MNKKPIDTSIYRMSDILKTLSFHTTGLTFTEINKSATLPKSSLNKLLEALREENIIKYNKEDKKYHFGSFFWEVAMNFNNELQVDELAQDYLEQFRDKYNLTVQLAILDGQEIIYLKKFASFHPLQLESKVGSRIPAYATGLGKALLSCFTQEKLFSIYPNEQLSTYTDNTIHNRTVLLDELREARKKGFSCDFEEYTPGICCYAVPIIDYQGSPLFAISFSMTRTHYNVMSSNNLNRMIKDLKQYSKKISNRIGVPMQGKNIIY